jgi:hypothetical protein
MNSKSGINSYQIEIEWYMEQRIVDIKFLRLLGRSVVMLVGQRYGTPRPSPNNPCAPLQLSYDSHSKRYSLNSYDFINK